MENCVKKYHIVTYGCQMNVHESEKLAGILENLGYELEDNVNNADVVVFNTCCIRENAEQKAEGNIGALKNLKKNKKDLIIAVCGCMTQQNGRAEKLVKKFPFIDIVFGTHNLENFKELLLKKLSQKKKVIDVLDSNGLIFEGTPKKRTSFPNAWVNISYGCNNFCSYCIVPYVRGRERSRKLEDIVNECKELISLGYKEITLLGQNVNSYGKDLDNCSFSTLINEVSKIEGDFRLSFMTNHPKDLTEDLVIAIANSNKTTKVIHLPIQAGSNRILKLMNRKYTKEDYLNGIECLRKHIPDISITTDIMVGFPTETEEDFLDTVDIVKKVGFTNAFTFVYSRRKGTPADKMEGQVEERISKDRIIRLIAIQNQISSDLAKGFIGKSVKVLCEDFDAKKQKHMGRDQYGRMVYFDAKNDAIGQFYDVLVTNSNGVALYGEI